jgi:6-phosphofructokinase
MYKQIGILTGGGDAPGLNAVIRAVVRTAIGEFGMKIIGIEDSFEGILGEPHTMSLTQRASAEYFLAAVPSWERAIAAALSGW